MEKNNSENTIIIFTKVPESGNAKSRITATHGKETALKVYNELLYKTSEIVSKLDYHVAFTGMETPGSLLTVFSKASSFFKQKGENLGKRLCNAFLYLFNIGYKNICAIGTDCPYLTENDFTISFSKLEKGIDIIIGPAFDGGYYLIGCCRKSMDVFSAKKWSQPDLFKETMEIINAKGYSYYLLKKLNDIDYMGDYLKWKKEI